MQVFFILGAPVICEVNMLVCISKTFCLKGTVPKKTAFYPQKGDKGLTPPPPPPQPSPTMAKLI